MKHLRALARAAALTGVFLAGALRTQICNSFCSNKLALGCQLVKKWPENVSRALGELAGGREIAPPPGGIANTLVLCGHRELPLPHPAASDPGDSLQDFSPLCFQLYTAEPICCLCLAACCQVIAVLEENKLKK